MFKENLNSRTKQIRPNKVKVVQASPRNESFELKHIYCPSYKLLFLDFPVLSLISIRVNQFPCLKSVKGRGLVRNCNLK